ncbi:hypothetical protein A6U86_19915 [Rhizobium sp. AC27/96]|uniref:site-specific integrase n=1 Tax=Rhizobium sp. AC27/96 TaxID=1841653 RepID=UPI000828ED3F|nr:site-specific integrase [Rhizobium sp. AC27/96]OCI91793.1 hypothetical protein A6U86_19915 [Rhizobium sp. AC27/96]
MPKVLFTDDDFEIDRFPAPQHPIPTTVDSGVPLIVAAFLAHRRRAGMSVRTVRKEAYEATAFCDYLRDRGIDWWSVDQTVVTEYLETGGQRDSNIVLLRPSDVEVIYRRTLLDKRDIIYSLYSVLQNHVGLLTGVVEPEPAPSIISPDVTPYRWPLPYRRRPVDFGIRKFETGQDSSSKLERRKEKERLRHGRPTPDAKQSKMVIQEALERDDENRAATFHLAAKLQRYATARSGGVADLCVAAVRAGILEEFEISSSLTRELPGLALMAGERGQDRALREELIRLLQDFRDTGRRFIFINVIEKGGKVRHLAIPIELVIEILDYIWEYRHRQVLDGLGKGRVASDHVFLSYETLNAFLPDSIGKELRKIFRKLGIPGSPHRLRAAGAEDIVRDLYLKQKAQNPSAIDFRSILEIASEILGHRNTKTIKRYINKIHREEYLLKGYAVVLNHPEDADIIRSITEILNQADNPSGDSIRSDLKSLIEAHGISPVPLMPPSPLASWRKRGTSDRCDDVDGRTQ